MAASRLARFNFSIALISLLLLPLSAAGTRFGLFHFRTGMLLFALAMLLAIVAIIVAALATRRQTETRSRRLLSQSSLLSLPAVTFFGFTLFSGGGAPLIHNVTTDPDNPPRFVAAAQQRVEGDNPLTYTEETARLQREAYPELATHYSSLSPDEAFQRARRLCDSLGWEVYAEDPANGRIEAVASTRWFGFKDDVVIRLRPHDSGTAVDLRSVSRVGKGDLGANARRIEKFLALFETAD